MGQAIATKPGGNVRLLRLAPWGLLLVFMAKVGTYENARQLAPYYVFLFPVWLSQVWHAEIIRQARWQQLGVFVMGLTAALVVTSADRPLFPARAIWSSLQKTFPHAELVNDESTRYVHSRTEFLLAWQDFIKRVLPKGETVIGYYTRSLVIDMDETTIWLPYGKYCVERFCQDDKPERLRARGIRYVVAESNSILDRQGSMQGWLKQYDATCVDYFTFSPESESNVPPSYYLVKLN